MIPGSQAEPWSNVRDVAGGGGVGKSCMALRYLEQGRTLSIITVKPVNSTSSWQNTNLSGFSVMPFLPQMSNHFAAWWKLPSIVSAHSGA